MAEAKNLRCNFEVSLDGLELELALSPFFSTRIDIGIFLRFEVKKFRHFKGDSFKVAVV
jgi:hypothetical protein